MSKIIKVSTDLEVTVHDFPQGNMREQNRALYELIGNGCDMIEHVMPVRLYNELGHSNHVKRSNSKCVSMLIDEEGLLKDNEATIGSHMSIETVIKTLESFDLSRLQQVYLLHLSNDNSQAADFKRRVQALTGKEVYLC